MSEMPARKTTTLVDIEVRNKLLYVKFMGPQIGQRESPIISLEVEPYLKAAGKDLKEPLVLVVSRSYTASGVAVALRVRLAQGQQLAVQRHLSLIGYMVWARFYWEAGPAPCQRTARRQV